nr:ATP-binding protein [Candidatus Sigynarchaeota archaeon]
MSKDESTKKENTFNKEECIKQKYIQDVFVGIVISDIKGPTTSQEFRIGFNRSVDLELGEVIAIIDEPRESVVYGIVEEIYNFEDVKDYVQKMMENNWDFTKNSLIKRTVLAFADITLLRRYSQNLKFDHALLGITPNQPVYRVGDEGLLQAFDLKREGVPIGVYALSSGQIIDDAVIRVDIPYLLGKEAAHVNVSGQSGFGKTAFVLFLLKSLYASMPKEDRVKVVIFNVKQDDLLWLDKDNDELTAEDKALYTMMGVPATAFDKVVFYGTDLYKKETKKFTLASLRPDVKKFYWSWNDVKNHIHFAIGPLEDWDDKQMQCLHIAQEQSLPDMNAAFNYAKLKSLDKTQTTPHYASWGRFARIIKGIYLNNKGLLRKSTPIPYDKIFKENDILVIDINEAYFTESTQRLIFGKIVDDLQHLHQEKKLNADFLIIVTDELSRYAAKTADENLRKVKEIIRGIAARGRSIQTPLFALEQFPSEIDDQILGNINTKVFTRTKQSELRNSLYAPYSGRVKFEMINLKKGYAFAENSQFPDLIKIRYPRPPCAQKDKGFSTKMVRPADEAAGADAVSDDDNAPSGDDSITDNMAALQ